MRVIAFFVVLIFIEGCEPVNQITAPLEGMVLIPGGTYEMGAKSKMGYRDEYPRHEVEISSFHMDKTEVTNAQYFVFVEATGYITVAERQIDWEEMEKELPPGTPKPADSLLKPGSLVFQMTEGPVDLNQYWQWWKWTIGANWRHPEGPGSDISDRMDHPVVHIAWEDANAYAKWAGKRLPTEAEWEWAAMGGIDNAIYPWGDESISSSTDKANFWQGSFPYNDYKLDGFGSTSPVGSFPPNGYGLYDMAGNVWELCSDLYSATSYKEDFQKGTLKDPKGSKVTYDPMDPYARKKHVVRGGSFLCNEVYCSGYRTSRRMPKADDSGANHEGFRCVKDI